MINIIKIPDQTGILEGVCQAIVGKNLNLPISWKFK